MEHARTERLTNEKRRERSRGHQQELPELCDVLAGEGKCDLAMEVDVTITHFARLVLFVLDIQDPYWDTE